MQRKPIIWDTIQHTAGNTKVPVTLPNRGGLPLDKPLHSLLLRWAGRLTIAGGPGTIVLPEAGPNIFDRITIRGKVRGGSEQVVWQSDGPMAYNYAKLHFAGTNYENSSTPTLATANASYDIAVSLPIYFFMPGLDNTPMKDAQGRRIPTMTERTLLYANRFETLILEVTLSNGFNFVNGAGTRALTAYGSGAGNPTVTVTPVQVNMGNYQNTIPAVLVKRSLSIDTQLLNSGVDSVIGNTELHKGTYTSRAVVRVGTQVGANLEYPAFNTLSDTSITKIKAKINDKNVWETYWIEGNQFVKGETGVESMPVGYQVLSFVQDDLREALNTLGMPGSGTRLALAGDYTGAANQQVQCLQEEIIQAY